MKAHRSRAIGVVYLLYFVTAIVGTAVIAPKFPLLGEIVVFISTLIYAVLTVMLYFLFRPVNLWVSLVAACLSLLGCTVTAIGTLHFAVSINPLVFFGPFCMLIGYLILISALVPRFIGILMVLAGIAWLAYTVPSLAPVMATPAKALGILAEASLMFWMLIVGVDTTS